MSIKKETQPQTMKVKYITFGSPLMDTIYNVDEDFLNMHGIKLDTTMHVDSNSNIVINDLKTKYDPKYIAGGCSFNTIRIINWMLKEDGAVGGIGSIGNDNNGRIFKEQLEGENIQHFFQEFENNSTGTSLVMCYKKERAHLTDLGASVYITEDYINSIWDSLSDVRLIFTELYILSSKRDILLKLAGLCLDTNKIFSFNFPSSFFLSKFHSEILEMITYGDVIFANKLEAKFFVEEILKVHGYDFADYALILSKLPKLNLEKPRICVITCGPEPAHICVFDHLNNEIIFQACYEPCLVDRSKIIDANGAGDAFSGGFLSYYLKNYDFESCMNAGHYAASKIIQKKGFDVPFDILATPKVKKESTNEVINLVKTREKNGLLPGKVSFYKNEK